LLPPSFLAVTFDGGVNGIFPLTEPFTGTVTICAGTSQFGITSKPSTCGAKHETATWPVNPSKEVAV
jgi:hypothetical protein